VISACFSVVLSIVVEIVSVLCLICVIVLFRAYIVRSGLELAEMPKYTKGVVNCVNWVQCDVCDRYELYENCGMEGEYDQKKVDAASFTCRLCVMEEWKSEEKVRVTELETWKSERMSELEEWKRGLNERVSELELGLNAVSESLKEVKESGKVMKDDSVTEDSVKVLKSECESAFAQQREATDRINVMGGSVMEVQLRVDKLWDKLGSVEGTLAEMSVKQLGFDELLESTGEAELYAAVLSRKQKKEMKKSTSSPSSSDVAGVGLAGVVEGAVGGEVTDGVGKLTEPSMTIPWCADEGRSPVLVVGSSLARQVGQALKTQDRWFDKLDFGGARIEHIAEKLAVLGDRPDDHIVVMVGTNNLERDSTKEMMKKYEDLVGELKKRKYRKVSIVAVLKRGDWRFDGTISCINRELRALCEKNELGFVDAAIDRRWMLAKDGLHLNRKGCDSVGRAIFKHCTKHLN